MKNLPNVAVRNSDEIYGSDFGKTDVKKQKFLSEAHKIQFLNFIFFSLISAMKVYFSRCTAIAEIH